MVSPEEQEEQEEGGSEGRRAARRDALCEGARMRIHGLHSYQEFNGKVGTVCNHNVASSRRKLGMVYVLS